MTLSDALLKQKSPIGAHQVRCVFFPPCRCVGMHRLQRFDGGKCVYEIALSAHKLAA